MALVVNTNIPSIAASRAVYETREDMELAMERLSSGKRINSSRDDAAGQTVVSRMRAQISSLNQAVRNANDGISMVNTYDGAADEIEDILVRMRELATLAENGTYVSADITNAGREFVALVAEIDRIAEKTTWNGTAVFFGGSTLASGETGTAAFQVGFGTGTGEKVTASFGNLGSTALGEAAFAATAGSFTTAAQATTQKGLVDTAIDNLNENRATAGAVINRLEHTVNNLMNVVQRTEEARSRIEDADFAAESANLAKANVLAQAGTAMLAQANQSPQYILTLLRG
jgi:flagellin